MVQSFDYDSINKPNYNAVKINIKKPEVNAGNNRTSYVDDNGIYNAVNIEIDNPTVNTEPKKIYDYPCNTDILTYDMFNINPIPVKYPISYHTTNVILPKMENEFEVGIETEETEKDEIEATSSEEKPQDAEIDRTEIAEAIEETEAQQNEITSFQEDAEGVKLDKPEIPEVMEYFATEQSEIIIPQENAEKVGIDEPKNTESIKNTESEQKEITPSQEISEGTELDQTKNPETVEYIATEEYVIPSPNYTTLDAKKGTLESGITFHGSENAPSETPVSTIAFRAENVENKKPEIIPGEDITPDVDIPLVISNLANDDYDIQAQQMEEIARIAFEDPQKAIPYIVRDVFSSLINISKKDTTNLKAPTQAQIDARKKLITNFLILENSKQQNLKDVKLPYKITDEDFALANNLSQMEMAERNKEYALYTIAILAKIYTDEVEKQTGNVVPFTDLPGSAAIVDDLRYSPNAGVKIAAIDALRHIQRKEYAEELYTLYSLAQADPNPQVAMSAARALQQTTQQR